MSKRVTGKPAVKASKQAVSRCVLAIVLSNLVSGDTLCVFRRLRLNSQGLSDE
jgi:hypothetical protein